MNEIDEAFHEHLKHNPQHPHTSPTLLAHVSEMETTTQKQEFELLSSISNFHRHGFPNTRVNIRQIIHPENFAHVQHMLFEENCLPNEYGNFTRKNLPVSPRNRAMYFISTEQDQEFHQLVRYLMDCDDPEFVSPPEDHDIPQPPRKKRKQSARIISVTQQAIAAEIGLQDINSADPMRDQYTTFTEQLLSDGIIKWRSHKNGTDICLMNDYSPTTGLLLPQGFVHVTCKKINGQTVLQCTCAIYDLIKRAAHQDINIQDGDEAIPDLTLTCMHCTFFEEHLLDSYQKLQVQNTSLSPALTMVNESLQYMENEVQLVGSVITPSCTKFSVKAQGEQHYSVLNVSFNRNKCYVICTNGMCAVGLKNKRNIARTQDEQDRRMRKVLDVPDAEGRRPREKKRIQCNHLDTFYKHIDHIRSFFPDYFGENNKDEDNEEENINYNVQANDEINNEDVNLRGKVKGNFDIVTGLWSYKSLTDHKPRQMHNPHLIKCTQHRNGFISQRALNEENGLYCMHYLKPSGKDVNGQPLVCDCGLEYKSEQGDNTSNYVQQGGGTLYTRNGPVQVEYYNLRCPQGVCEIPFTKSAEEKCIFMLTKNTAIGDEVAWDFIELVKKTKCSFTAYCNEMTRRYQTNNMLAGSFMSPNTFIQVVFGWMAAHKIDFRKEIDPWCKYTPKILACDGTHIGVSLRHMNIHPIEKPDLPDEAFPARHQRNDRVLIPDKGARIFLRYLCNRYKNTLKPNQIMRPEVQQQKSIEFLAHVAATCDPEVIDLVRAFVEESVHDDVLDVLERIFFMMSGDAALSSVLPFLSHDIIEDCLNDFEEDGPNPEEKVETFCMEIAQLMIVSKEHGCKDICLNFCKYIIKKIRMIHSHNRPIPDVEEIPGSYDPRNGTAYYFSESGNQLRKMPHYSVSGKPDRCDCDNNADQPEIDKCTKLYPRASYGGFGYIFLWFCPIHGHSYGFHCINGGEGRKDVFSSLYKYLEKQPEHIFYDFACQLHEYCLNREPELFKNTRFWHDLFHSIGHVCGINYKSGRIRGLQGLNTEICEQWNGFLQCIKYTGSHLTQEHFSFLMQFFIAIQNREKTETYRNIIKTVLAGRRRRRGHAM